MKRTSILALGTGILLCVGVFAPGCGDSDGGGKTDGGYDARATGAEVRPVDGFVLPGTGGAPGDAREAGPQGTGGSKDSGGEAGPKLDSSVDKVGPEAQPVKIDVGQIDVSADAPDVSLDTLPDAPPAVDAEIVIDANTIDSSID